MMGWMAPLRHLGAKVLVGENQSADREPSMNEITTVGLDLAKNVLFPPGPFRFLVDGHRPAIVGHELDSALF
jgi:hypothetical protein